MPYVVKRSEKSQNWYYRETPPADVKALLTERDGKAPADVWKSLRTSDRREADRRVVSVRAQQHAEWDAIRASRASLTWLPSTHDIIDAVTARVHEGFLRVQRRNLRDELASGEDLEQIAAKRRKKLVQVELLPLPSDIEEMERLAAAVARAENWDLAAGSGARGERWNDLVATVTKAVQLARADLAEITEGKLPDTSRAAVVGRLGGTKEFRATAKSGEDISSLFDRYVSEKQREGKRTDTLETERKIVNHFASFVGKQSAVNAITRADIRDFKQALSDVPHRWTVNDELSGLALREAAGKWREIGGATRSLRTVNRELSAVSAFFAWLKDNAYVDENVALGFRSRVDKAKHAYPPYSHSQLAELFRTPLFVGCDGKKEHLAGTHRILDWRYWLPLCLLYSGARTGEIAQLHCKDIREEQGVWVFDLVEGVEGDEKRLKNNSSRRIIPIHTVLMQLGFLQFVEKQLATGSKRLFPDIRPGQRGDWSYQPSKFWARYLQRIEMKVKGLGLHSFRHTFADECRRSGVDVGVIQALLGHADHSTTGGYGIIPLGTLLQRKEAVESLSYNNLQKIILQVDG